MHRASPDWQSECCVRPLPEASAVEAPPEPADARAESASGGRSDAEAVTAPVAEQPPSGPAGKNTDKGSDSNPRKRLLPWWAWLVIAAVLIAGLIAALVATSSPSGPKAAPTGAHTTAPTTQASASTKASASSGVGNATASGTPRTSTSATSAATSSASSTSSSSASSTATPSGDVATQLSSAITHYYTLVPGNLSQAWGYMTADYQTNHAHGFANYSAFWNPIQSVSLTDLVAQAPSTVVVTINYDYKNGQQVHERTEFGLVFSGGIWKIASSSVESSQ